MKEIKESQLINSKLNSEKHVDRAGQTHFTKLSIIKNLIIISLSFMFIFTAYDGVSMLQSTMNGENGVGTVSQAVVYFFLGLTSLLLPKYVIKKIGCRMGILLATSLYWPYQAANFYPEWFTLIPSAFLVGIGGSLICSTQCTYFNKCATMYVRLMKEKGTQNENLKKNTSSIPPNVHLASVKVMEDASNRPSEQSNRYKIPILPNYVEDKNFKICTFSEFDSSKDVTVRKSLKTNTVLNNPNQKVTLRKHDDIELCERSLHKQCIKGSTFSKGMLNFQNTCCRYMDALSKHLTKSSSHPGPVINNTEVCLNHIELSHTIKKEKLEVKSSLNAYNFKTRNSKCDISDIEIITARFFGCHGLVYYTSQIWSNLITYYVLNMTVINETTAKFPCGAAYCEAGYINFNNTANDISPDARNLLSIITVTLSLMAVLVVLLFLDSLNDDKETITFSFDILLATLKHFKKKEQFLLIPLAVFNGMAQGFYTADFTKSYIKCAWSTAHVGLVTASYGLFCGMTSTVSGYLVKYLGRVPIIVSSQIINIGMHVFLLYWEPDANNPILFFLGAGLYGGIMGVYCPQAQSFIGILSRTEEEAAFSGYYLCSSFGWFVSFVISDYICTDIKLYILMVVSTVGFVGYVIVERDFVIKINDS